MINSAVGLTLTTSVQVKHSCDSCVVFIFVKLVGEKIRGMPCSELLC
jgi:hypothetical protein